LPLSIFWVLVSLDLVYLAEGDFALFFFWIVLMYLFIPFPGGLSPLSGLRLIATLLAYRPADGRWAESVEQPVGHRF